MKKYIILFLIAFAISSCGTKPYSRKVMDSSIMDMNSTYYLVHNNTWNLVSTEHFKFYFDKAIPEDTKQGIKDAQEKNFGELATLMGLTNEEQQFKVSYWLFKDRAQKRKLTKVDSDAHALSTLNAIFHLPKNAKGGQELGHVLTQKFWGFIPKTSNYSLIIDEGFNYYIDDVRFYNNSLTKETKAALAQDNTLNVVNLIKRNDGEKIHGVATGSHRLNESIIAGAFVKYLIETHGIKKFQELWKLAVKDNTAKAGIFKKVYGTSLKKIHEAFIATLTK